MNPSFEDEYLDVLQNIESTLESVYREHEEMTDYNADKIVEVLIREYKAENSGRTAQVSRLQAIDMIIYDRLKSICEWRLGREKLLEPKMKEFQDGFTPLSLDETMACLKRVQKSILRWQKEGGRRGYFYFIDQFVR